LEKIIIIIGGGRGSLEVERGATMTVSIDRTLALFAVRSMHAFTVQFKIAV
jgi:hypothetical protein